MKVTIPSALSIPTGRYYTAHSTKIPNGRDRLGLFGAWLHCYYYASLCHSLIRSMQNAAYGGQLNPYAQIVPPAGKLFCAEYTKIIQKHTQVKIADAGIIRKAFAWWQKILPTVQFLSMLMQPIDPEDE